MTYPPPLVSANADASFMKAEAEQSDQPMTPPVPGSVMPAVFASAPRPRPVSTLQDRVGWNYVRTGAAARAPSWTPTEVVNHRVEDGDTVTVQRAVRTLQQLTEEIGKLPPAEVEQVGAPDDNADQFAKVAHNAGVAALGGNSFDYMGPLCVRGQGAPGHRKNPTRTQQAPSKSPTRKHTQKQKANKNPTRTQQAPKGQQEPDNDPESKQIKPQERNKSPARRPLETTTEHQGPNKRPHRLLMFGIVYVNNEHSRTEPRNPCGSFV